MTWKDYMQQVSVKQTTSRNLALRSTYWVICAVVLLFLLTEYVKHNWGYAVDDSYITFRYAQNARLGYGFVFNVGERFYGSTATGYAVILAIIAKVGDLLGVSWGIPDISTYLSALGIAATAAVVLQVAQNRVAQSGDWWRLLFPPFAALLLFVLPLSNLVSGHETYFYVGLVAVATYIFIFSNRLFVATAILVVATTCRPDVTLLALLLYCVVGLREVGREKSIGRVMRRLVPPGLLYLVGIFSWCLWTRLYYGSFLPQTLGAKEVQTKLGVFPLFDVANLTEYLTTQFNGDYWTIIAIVGATLLAVCIFHACRMLLSAKESTDTNGSTDDLTLFALTNFIYAIGLAVAYLTMHVSIWWWYVSPIGIFLLVAGLCSFVKLVPWCGFRDPKKNGLLTGWAIALAVIALLGLASPLAHATKAYLYTINVNPHLASYDFFEGYLRAENPNGTSVATSEPGTFAYRMGPKFRVLDVLGLVTPEVVEAIQSGNLNYVVPHFKPRYAIVSWEGAYQPNGYAGFADHYQFVGEFNAPYWEAALKHGAYLFERIEDESKLSKINRIDVHADRARFVSAGGLDFGAKIGDGAQCNLTTLDGRLLLSNVPVAVRRSSPSRIEGWASSIEHLPVGAIFVQLRDASGRRYTARARYRVDDYSVGAYLKWKKNQYPSGFSGNFDFGDVVPGRYAMDLLYYSHGDLIECSNGRLIDVQAK